MTRKSYPLIIVLSALGLSMIACSLVGKSESAPTSVQEEKADANPSASDNKNEDGVANEEESSSDSSPMDSVFPLPNKAKIVLSNPDLVTGTVKISMDDIVAFYRNEYKKQGLTEDTLLTTISDTTYSLVFKGSSIGKSVVVQGTELGDGTIAFSVRYE